MKRKLTSILLFSALLAGGASTFVSCTDNESDNAYNTSATLAGVIAQQKSELEGLNEWLGDLKTKQPSLADAIDARIKENLAAMDKGAISELGQYATLDEAIRASKAYQGLKDEIAAVEKLRQSDSLAHAKLDSALQAQIDTIANHVSSIEELDKKMQTALDYLVNKNLSNVAINATENPVVGYWNAAFLGSQLNLASSFYGTASQGSKTFGVEGGDALGKDANAGYIYVSLNPTQIDPACITKLTLVDSQGNEADGFKLGDLQNTSKVLTYGYSRAAETSANGFYQIPVIATNPKAPFSLDKGELKSVATNILNELKNPKENNLKLKEAAKALYGVGSSINNSLTAYTVKAEYYLYDATTGELVKKTQVAPTYNVAAFNVKPLSFNFLKDNEKLNNLGKKLANFELEDYAIVSLSDELRKFAEALNVKFEYKGKKEITLYTVLLNDDVMCVENGKGGVDIVPKSDPIKTIKTIENATLETVEYVRHRDYDDGASAEEIVPAYLIKTTDNSIANVIESINNQIAEKLSPVQDKLNAAADKWENVIGKMDDLIQKYGAKVGSVNKLLQPTIIYKSATGVHHFSTLGGRLGTRFVGTGETTIYATSWTAELLAPAYKKSVSIDGDAEILLPDGTSAAKPFSGDINKLTLKIKKAGNYTVTYKAVDYSGVEVTKTFYITAE